MFFHPAEILILLPWAMVALGVPFLMPRPVRVKVRS